MTDTETKLAEYVEGLLPMAWRDHKYPAEQELLEQVEAYLDHLPAPEPKMQRQFWLVGHLIDTEIEGWEEKIFDVIDQETGHPNSLKSIALKLTGELGLALKAYDNK